VENTVTERLGKFISQANVSVVVTKMAPKNIYVSGAVKKEGPVVYIAGMTVLQALSQAGGLNDYAKHKKIYVLHTENGRTYRSDFNYDEVLRGERMEQNIILLPNDTIVIPH
jgi:polysaccharide export outer membrane protein